MAKEINTETSPGVFQLFDENRTFYFESDISSIPDLPTTMPSLASRWSHSSKPHASSHSTGHKDKRSAQVSVTGSTISSTDLRLPASIMASTVTPTTTQSTNLHHKDAETTQTPPHHHHKAHQRSHSEVRSQAVAAAVASGALEGPYRETHLGDDSILRSFKQGVAGASLNRTAPQAIPSHVQPGGLARSASSPSLPLSLLADAHAQDMSSVSFVSAAVSCESGLDVPEVRQRANSDPRKLTLVMEEEHGLKPLSAAGDSNSNAVVLKASPRHQTVAKFYQEGQSESESSPSPSPEARKRQRPFGTALSRGAGAEMGQMNLSRRVADWFFSTQPNGQVTRKEFNAFSPQSF